ncbi:uncharacterized protein LOC134838461 [Culicoides brevitarsis]|uniref:uncharacterized protein LOC134838461 n=1 Tax=Culicoides brevitarsis TaxID=469753 RepID=UPI00307C6D46
MFFIKSIIFVSFIYLGNAKLSNKDENLCVGKPDGTLLPHPENCSKFLNCNNGISFAGDCPADLYFNPVSSQCDYKENVSCHVQEIPEEDEKEDVECPETGVAFVASKIQCDWYYICMQGTPSRMICAEGMHFSETESRCESESTANCQIGVSSTTTTTNEPSTSNPSNEFDKFCKPDTLHSIPHPFNCNLFILCFNGTAIERFCDDGLHYSAKDSVCLAPREAKCIADGTICPKTNDVNDIVVVENIYDCNSFYMCFNGSPVPIQCGPNQHWNQEKGTCVLEENSNCKAIEYPFPNLNFKHATCQTSGSYFVPQQGQESILLCNNGVPTFIDYSPSICQFLESCTFLVEDIRETDSDQQILELDNAQLRASQYSKDSIWHSRYCLREILAFLEFSTLEDIQFQVQEFQERLMYPEDNVSCDEEIKPDPRCPQEETEESNVTHLPHDSDCTKFLVCVNGGAMEMQCPETGDGGHLHWNAEENTCDWPENAKCQK